MDFHCNNNENLCCTFKAWNIGEPWNLNSCVIPWLSGLKPCGCKVGVMLSNRFEVLCPLSLHPSKARVHGLCNSFGSLRTPSHSVFILSHCQFSVSGEWELSQPLPDFCSVGEWLPGTEGQERSI